MFRRFCLGFLLVTLSGCSGGGHWMSSEYLTGRGWARPPEQKPRDPLYCYRTLGEVNCYKTSQVGKGRLIEPVPHKKAEDAEEEAVAAEVSSQPSSPSSEPMSLTGGA